MAVDFDPNSFGRFVVCVAVFFAFKENNMIVIITFVAYLSVVISIGVFAYHVTQDMSDYVLGGRRLGGAVAALSAGASDMSAWLLMGLPGAVYLSGINQIWLPIGLCLGAYLNWQFVAARLRIYTEILNDSLTIPEYLVNRFRDNCRFLRIVCAAAILIFFVFYMSAGLVAGAFLVSQTFGFNYTMALWIGAAIIMTYTAFGGFLAVSWTDFLQGNLMMIALIITPIVAMNILGGMDHTLAEAEAHSLDFVNAFSGITTLGTISLLSWGLGYFGQPHIIVRFMSVKTVHEIPKAQAIGIAWMALSLFGAIFVGLVGMVYFGKSPLDNPELVFVALSKALFTPAIAGLIMAAILSSTMCAIDSQMLVSSSALTEDIYKGIFRKNASQKELVLIGRLAVFLIALIAIYIARDPNSKVLGLVSYAWAGLGSAFGPVVLFSLFWKRMTKRGAITGIVLGSITAMIWFRVDGGIFDVYELLPGFIFSTIGVVLGSLLDKKPISGVVEDFEAMENQLKKDFSIKS